MTAFALLIVLMHTVLQITFVFIGETLLKEILQMVAPVQSIKLTAGTPPQLSVGTVGLLLRITLQSLAELHFTLQNWGSLHITLQIPSEF